MEKRTISGTCVILRTPGLSSPCLKAGVFSPFIVIKAARHPPLSGKQAHETNEAHDHQQAGARQRPDSQSHAVSPRAPRSVLAGTRLALSRAMHATGVMGLCYASSASLPKRHVTTSLRKCAILQRGGVCCILALFQTHAEVCRGTGKRSTAAEDCTLRTTKNPLRERVWSGRKGWDSNPRSGVTPTAV